jgi:hypothetical protein
LILLLIVDAGAKDWRWLHCHPKRVGPGGGDPSQRRSLPERDRTLVDSASGPQAMEW